VAGLDSSHALPADLLRRHTRSPKGHKESKALRLAELFGHEGGGHGVYALDSTADAVNYQRLLNDRDAALKAMPKGTKYPYPPDVMQKMEAARQAGVPTERFAQQVEKIINGELRAGTQKKK
jgi:hypothetical protein